LIVAHRGAPREAPENTLPAIELAWQQGADGIDVDFHLTKDGEIVCLHDANTERVAGTRLVVKQSILDELRRLDVGIQFGPQWAGTRIPTLAEVLATIPAGKRIHLQIKSGPAMIPKLLEELEQSGLRDEQVKVLSFNAAVIRAFKDKTSQYQAFWLSSLKTDRTGQVTPSLETILDTLRQNSADGFASDYHMASEAMIRGVLDAGYEYHVWTIDDPDSARRFLDWGAMSITTNVPGYMREHLLGPTQAAGTL